jgi:hypothetical protein
MLKQARVRSQDPAVQRRTLRDFPPPQDAVTRLDADVARGEGIDAGMADPRSRALALGARRPGAMRAERGSGK